MYELVGYERVDYTSQKGRHVMGYRVHLFDNSPHDNLIGQAVFTGFISDENLVGNLSLGHHYQAVIDRRYSRLLCLRELENA